MCRNLPQILFHFRTPLLFQRKGLLSEKVVADGDRTAIGIDAAVGAVDKVLEDGHARIAYLLHPRPYDELRMEPALAVVVGVYRYEDQALRVGVDGLAEHFFVEFHLSDVEIVLQIHVVDMAEAVRVGEPYLYIAFDVFAHRLIL